MWMSSRKHASPLFSCDSFTSRPKRDLLLYVARHPGRRTSLQCALSKAQGPGHSVSNREPSGVVLLVLRNVESFPGAMSPLGSKEPTLFTETANLFGTVYHLLFTKFQTVEQL